MRLSQLLREAGIEAPREIRRRPSEYRTSFPLEELDLTLEDGASLRLVFKRLDWDALTDEARLAKPRFLHDPLREPVVYGSASRGRAARASPLLRLGNRSRGAADTGSSSSGSTAASSSRSASRALWEAAAGWLGAMHLRFGDGLDRHRRAATCSTTTATYYRRWIERARLVRPCPGQPESRARSVDWLAARYEPVIEELLAMPKTVIHGEFYASNVLVAGDAADPRVAPVDWELAAAAPGLIDLAALVSGGWSDDDREAIVSAYRSTVGPALLLREAARPRAPAPRGPVAGLGGAELGARRRGSDRTGSARRSPWRKGWGFERRRAC